MANELVEKDELDLGFGMNEIMPIFMVMMMGVMMSFMQTQQASTLQAQQFMGNVDERDLNCTGTLQWINLITDKPYVGWVSMVAHNNGPGSIFINVNNPDTMIEMSENDTREWNFLGTNQKINVVFYKSAGQIASISITGSY